MVLPRAMMLCGLEVKSWLVHLGSSLSVLHHRSTSSGNRLLHNAPWWYCSLACAIPTDCPKSAMEMMHLHILHFTVIFWVSLLPRYNSVIATFCLTSSLLGTNLFNFGIVCIIKYHIILLFSAMMVQQRMCVAVSLACSCYLVTACYCCITHIYHVIWYQHC